MKKILLLQCANVYRKAHYPEEQIAIIVMVIQPLLSPTFFSAFICGSILLINYQ